MGTKADFFAGVGPGAEWLGSTSHDGHPDRCGAGPLAATTEAEFRAAVEDVLRDCHGDNRGTRIRPSEGWPWSWDDHRVTEYAYAWDPARGAVASGGGCQWVTAHDLINRGERLHEGHELADDEVTNMAGRRGPGAGPGVIVLGVLLLLLSPAHGCVARGDDRSPPEPDAAAHAVLDACGPAPTPRRYGALVEFVDGGTREVYCYLPAEWRDQEESDRELAAWVRCAGAL